MDAASSLRDDNAVPRERDLSVCIGCGAVSQLRAGKWVAIGADVVASLDPEERAELAQHRRAVAMMLATVGPPPGRKGGRA